MTIYPQNRFASPLGIFLGAFTAPFLFMAAGLPGGWIFQGPAQFVLSIAATVGLMLVFSRASDWVWCRVAASRKPSRG